MIAQEIFGSLTKITVCISVFWPDFTTLSGSLPKRGAPALGYRKKALEL